MKFTLAAFTLSLSFTCLQAETSSDAWTSFRNGGTSQSTAENLPLHWAPDEGIAWQRELPGYGQSSPMLWNGTLYLTFVKGPQKEESVVMALDASSGKQLWEFSVETSSPAASYYAKSRAAPTPTIDQNGIYAFFEGGDVVALTHEGELKWQRSLTKEYGEFENGHGLGSSLAQTSDSIIVLIDHAGPSYLLALDKTTGENKWKTERKPRSSWTSPVVAQLQGREQIVASSNGTVDGYDAATGKTLWSFDGISGNTISSASVLGNRVFVGGGGDKSSCCLEFSNTVTGEYKVLWQSDTADSHYASPLPYRGNVYHVDKLGIVHCLDMATGQENYAEKISDICWTTPVAVGEHVYLFSKNGVSTILEAGPTYKQVAVNSLWDIANPPQPESYVQHAPQRSGPSLADQLKEADKNNDGLIHKDELPKTLQRSFARLDSNKDGAIDADEVKAMTARSSNRSGSSSFGDPIVYGLAVGDSSIFVRTGTHLYCLRKD